MVRKLKVLVLSVWIVVFRLLYVVIMVIGVCGWCCWMYWIRLRLLLFGRCMLVRYRLNGLWVSNLWVFLMLWVLWVFSFMWLRVIFSSLWIFGLLLMIRVFCWFMCVVFVS